MICVKYIEKPSRLLLINATVGGKKDVIANVRLVILQEMKGEGGKLVRIHEKKSIKPK